MDPNRFTEKSVQAIRDAYQVAKDNGNQQVEQLHLFHALVSQQGLITQLLIKLGINEAQIESDTAQAISRLPKIQGSAEAYASTSLNDVLNVAQKTADNMKDEYTSSSSSVPVSSLHTEVIAQVL